MLKKFMADLIIRGIRLSRLVRNQNKIHIFAPASAGSLGDQAMMEVVRNHFETEAPDALKYLYFSDWTPLKLRQKTNSIMVCTRSPNKMAIQTSHLVASSKAFAMFGADVVDGVYNPHSIVLRLQALLNAAKCHVPVAVLGASFSACPNPAVIKKLASVPNLHFCARDPVSYTRYEVATGRRATLTADLAFLLKPALRADNVSRACEWIRQKKRHGGTVVGVNVSSHVISDTPARLQTYVHAVGKWLHTNPSGFVVLIPHDFRQFGDVKPLLTMFDSLRSDYHEQMYMVQPPFDSWDVKALCGYVDAVITGRMHLAIATLGMGVIPLCVTYQGKFEGLMAHFNLDYKNIRDDELDDPLVFFDRLSAMMSQRQELQERVRQALPKVLEFSRRNFQWLDS